MGYDLHITRKKLWLDEEGPDISWDEWSAYVGNDPELRLAPELGKHMVAMSIKCEYPDPWLDWSEGSIETKNPDEAILAKMLKIAAALKAKVQGDDGEVYRSANFSDHYDED
jgi:hypothetical protein